MSGGIGMEANRNSAPLDRMYPFLSAVAERRRRARRHIDAGEAGRPTVLHLLNEALSTELVCVLRYRRHAALPAAAMAETVRGGFLKYAREEQGHADQIAARIVQLGGEPNMTPPAVQADEDAEDGGANTLADMLEEDLIAERIAIDSYREIVQYLGSSDPTTRQLLESILAVESGHAEELASLREDLLRKERSPGASSTRLPILDLQ